MNAEMPVRAMSKPLAKPASAPMPSAAAAAAMGGRPQTCIMPAKQMADRPPIAPIDKFIWPMAMMTICDIAITEFTAAASRRICTLNGDRNEGSNAVITIVATRMIASGPNQSVRRMLRSVVVTSQAPRSWRGRCAARDR